jgi:hypothetical protein
LAGLHPWARKCGDNSLGQLAKRKEKSLLTTEITASGGPSRMDFVCITTRGSKKNNHATRKFVPGNVAATVVWWFRFPPAWGPDEFFDQEGAQSDKRA